MSRADTNRHKKNGQPKLPVILGPAALPREVWCDRRRSESIRIADQIGWQNRLAKSVGYFADNNVALAAAIREAIEAT